MVSTLIVYNFKIIRNQLKFYGFKPLRVDGVKIYDHAEAERDKIVTDLDLW